MSHNGKILYGNDSIEQHHACNMCIIVFRLLTISLFCFFSKTGKAEKIDTMTVQFQKNAYIIDETYQNNLISIHHIDSILPQSKYAGCILYADTINYKHHVCEYEIKQEDTTYITPLFVTETVSPQTKPVHWSVTTNMVHWLALAHNVGIEFAINSQSTIGISGSCAWFSHKSKQRVYRWMVGELSYHHFFHRYDKPLGGFIGLFAQTGEFEMMFSPRNRKGEFTSVGICGGYRWPLKKKLFIEAEAGIGYMYIDYRHALDIDGVLIRQGRKYCNYILPSRLTVSLIYRLGKNK